MATKLTKRRKMWAVIKHDGLSIPNSTKSSAYSTYAQDCDASFGTKIAAKDCDAAIQDFIATSVRDEAWARGPVLRPFTRNRDDPTPRNVMPQGFPYKTCAIGFDLAGSSGQPVVDSYKTLVEKIKELVQACVIDKEPSKSHGIGGRMRFGNMVFVVSNPSIRAVQDTCLAFPKQHSDDLGECVARRAAILPSPSSASINPSSDPLPQNGQSILPGLQPSGQGFSQQPNGTQEMASQRPSGQDPTEQVHFGTSVADQQVPPGLIVMTPTLRSIQANHPDLYLRIAQQIVEIEAHQQIGHESTVQGQPTLQRLSQLAQQPAAPAQLHLTSQQLAQQQLFQQQIIQQQLDQRRHLLEQQIIQERLAQQRLAQQQMQAQQLAQQSFQGQQSQDQQLQGHQLQGPQFSDPQPIVEQPVAADFQQFRQQSTSPPHHTAAERMKLRGRPGSDESDDTLVTGPLYQGPSLPMGQPLTNNLATPLNPNLTANDIPPGPNQIDSAGPLYRRPTQRLRLTNQSAAPEASISASDFDRMLQEYSVVAGGSVGQPRRASSPSVGSIGNLFGPATSLFGPLMANNNEPDPNEVNQNPRPPTPNEANLNPQPLANEMPRIPRPQGPIGKPPRPGKRRKGRDP